MVDEAPEEGEVSAAGGSVLKKYGPLAAIVLLAQVVLAWVVIQFTLKDDVSEPPEEELLPPTITITSEGKKEAGEILPHYYTSENLKITANPAGTNAERFVVASVQLGLVAFNREEKPPDDNITDNIDADPEILPKIARYEPKIRAILNEIIRSKTVDQFDSEAIVEVQDEMKERLNNEVFQRLFASDEENKKEVKVQEIVFSELLIQ